MNALLKKKTVRFVVFGAIGGWGLFYFWSEAGDAGRAVIALIAGVSGTAALVATLAEP